MTCTHGARRAGIATGLQADLRTGAKTLLRNAWYYGSLAARGWQRRRDDRAGQSPVTVLFYHRIADDGAGAWTYPNRLFARQVRWLQRHFELISLEETQRRGARRRQPSRQRLHYL